MSYDIEIENSINYGILNYANIFDFKDTPNENIFENFYDFCRENLNINSQKTSITPNIFLYTNSFNVNAKAGYIKGHSVILINLGLMKNCIDNYLYNDKLNELCSIKFSDLVKKIDNQISTLAFQITTQFTYYHELAHLFQFTKRKINEIELQERKIDDENFDIIRHKLEINADTYSAISIATHIQQYIEKSFGDEINITIANDTIKILGACILNYIINFSDNTEIYFDKHSHPHPFLRLMNIVLNIANHMDSTPNFLEKGIKLNGNEIFKGIIDFYEELEHNGVFETKFSDAVYQNSHLKRDIINYLAELLNFEDEIYENAMNVWNKHII